LPFIVCGTGSVHTLLPNDGPSPTPGTGYGPPTLVPERATLLVRAQPDPPLEAQDPIVGEHEVAQIIGSGELGILADQVCLDDLTGRRTRDSYVDGDLGADDLVL